MLACEEAFGANEKQNNSLSFDIRMRTPIGIRLGQITVFRNLGKVSGYMDILNHSELFNGTIDDEGNCELFGRIITLMRSVSYVATGKITQSSLELSITDERHILKITGTPCRP